jgi:4-hydroxymandelate oxidase
VKTIPHSEGTESAASSSDSTDIPVELADLTLAELHRLGLTRMPEAVRVVWEHGLGLGNEAAWQRWALRPRVLRDMTNCDTATTVLSQRIELPVIVGPHALQVLCHPDGEVATATGSARAGTFMTLSSAASRYSPEQVGAVGPFWIMLAFFRDRSVIRATIDAAVTAGATAVCVTVDYFPMRPYWPREARLALGRCADDLGFLNWYSGEQQRLLQSGFDLSATWEDLDWLRDLSSLPLVVKGIMTAEDARLAVEHGASAVVVSNHAGHTVMDSLPTAEMLPEVVEAAGTELEVLVDGGIRSGADVLRAIALGARAVMIGRPNLIGLSLDGADGVHRILSLMRAELEGMMVMTGASRVADIDRTMIAWRG